jgi:hypothetical protein
MKAVYVFLVSFICLHLFACDKNTTLESVNLSNETANTQKMKLKITIGTKEFTATLNNDETAKAFQTMLPLTITMSELNGNEKYFYFDTKLPTNASSGGNIHRAFAFKNFEIQL